MTPTNEQIKKEIETLKQIRPKVRPYTAFGDSNTDAITVQIEVLEDDLYQEDIDRKYDDGDWSDHERESAEYALNWREGGEEISPVENWSGLVQD